MITIALDFQTYIIVFVNVLFFFLDKLDFFFFKDINDAQNQVKMQSLWVSLVMCKWKMLQCYRIFPPSLILSNNSFFGWNKKIWNEILTLICNIIGQCKWIDLYILIHAMQDQIACQFAIKITVQTVIEIPSILLKKKQN